MIKFKPNEIFDLNKVGLWISILIALLMVLYPIKLMYLIPIEMILLCYGYYLYKGIKKYKDSAIVINKHDKWFVDNKTEMHPVILKDYWLLKQYIFFWAKGPKTSVSFVVTRSIIGPQRFSQLRALIK